MKARNLLGLGYAMAVMKATVGRIDHVASTGLKTSAYSLVPPLLFFALLGFEIIRHLGIEWSHNPQYGYGWSAPFLALYLGWKRWQERPAAAEPSSRPLSLAIILFCAFLFLPIRFVAEANPDWRVLSWVLSLSAVAIAIAFVFLVGGRPWARHFAFPLLFFLVAVPWPVQFEQFIIQNLMRAVTAINVFLLGVAGIPALRHGNVIEVSSGFIGIEEACSGVRSLQATLMVSLFLGELYSFTVGRRLFLVLAGGVLAFICNLIRTAILVWVGANHGAAAIEAWHDPAGLTILLACLFGLWALSLVIQRFSHDPESHVPSPRTNPPIRVPTQLLMAGLTMWFLLVEGGVHIWYRVHQSSIASSRWSARWPESENAYKSVTIAPETQALLRYNEGGGATWKGPDRHPWMMYFFRWLPGRTAALFVKIHRPDICLPASGLTMSRDDGIRLITINGVNLPVRSYRFDDHGMPLHVFYCYWDARSTYDNVKTAVEEDWTARGRLRAAFLGRREIGAQMLEIVVWGYEEDGEANLALRRQLAQIIAPG